jgi:hypothetical protein
MNKHENDRVVFEGSMLSCLKYEIIRKISIPTFGCLILKNPIFFPETKFFKMILMILSKDKIFPRFHCLGGKN